MDEKIRMAEIFKRMIVDGEKFQLGRRTYKFKRDKDGWGIFWILDNQKEVVEVRTNCMKMEAFLQFASEHK